MSLRNLTLVFFFIAAFALGNDAAAGVYKCVDSDGSITYAQTPCPNQVTTTVNTPSASQASATMDCGHANQFGLTIARSMKGGRNSSSVFAQYGGIEGLSKSAVNIINYVYSFQYSDDISADRIAALAQNKCKARSFGEVTCESMPYQHIEEIGGCDQDEADDATDGSDTIDAVLSAEAAAAQNVETVAKSDSAQTFQNASTQPSTDKRQQQCKENLKSKIDSINASMRSGYSSAQGEQYRQQLRTLRKRMNDC